MNKITKGLFIGLILLTLTGCNNTNNNDIVNKTIKCEAEGSQYKQELLLTYNSNKVLKVKSITYYDSNDDMMTKEDLELIKDVFKDIKGINTELINGNNNELRLEIEVDYNNLDLELLNNKEYINKEDPLYNMNDFTIDNAIKELEENHYICNK